jgi:hypothetical protein
LPALQIQLTTYRLQQVLPLIAVEQVEALERDHPAIGSGDVDAALLQCPDVQRRRVHAEFIARGLRSRDDARRTGEYADAVIDQLQLKLDAARIRIAKTDK